MAIWPTYIGAMPASSASATPIAGIPALPDRQEIDKMGGEDFRGVPRLGDATRCSIPSSTRTSATTTSICPFDLSKVLFICTANTLDTIPLRAARPDGRDPELSGYTHDEKLGIAKRYLVPKQLEAHGLKKSNLTIPDSVLRLVIAEYTREAGVRELERQIATLCRKAATQIARGEAEKVRHERSATLREWLGPRRYSAEARRRTAEPGVATGLSVHAGGRRRCSSSRRRPIPAAGACESRASSARS